MSKAVDFFHVIWAFQHFAGKPLYVADCPEVVSESEIQMMMDVLLRVAAWQDCVPEITDDLEVIAETQKLAAGIRKALQV